MTPAPEPVHQRVSGRLSRIVEDACPESHEVFTAPIDYDLPGERAAYAEAGVPAYWIVDPARGRLLALRLTDGAYEPYADGTGPVSLSWPVTVSFSVGDLATR